MERLHPEVAKLTGGDRRSIGRSNEVVADVLADPSLFDLIFDAIASDDPLIAMRAADAVEKVTARAARAAAATQAAPPDRAGVHPAAGGALARRPDAASPVVVRHGAAAGGRDRRVVPRRPKRHRAHLCEAGAGRPRSGRREDSGSESCPSSAASPATGRRAMRARGRKMLGTARPELDYRRSVASRTPNAISTQPVSRSKADLTRGRRSSSPMRLTKTAQPHSQRTPIRLKHPAQQEELPQHGTVRRERTVGQEAVKKTAILGFRSCSAPGAEHEAAIVRAAHRRTA